MARGSQRQSRQSTAIGGSKCESHAVACGVVGPGRLRQCSHLRVGPASRPLQLQQQRARALGQVAMRARAQQRVISTLRRPHAVLGERFELGAGRIDGGLGRL